MAHPPLRLPHCSQVSWPGEVRFQGTGQGGTFSREVQSRKTEGAGQGDWDSLRRGPESSEAGVSAKVEDGSPGEALGVDQEPEGKARRCQGRVWKPGSGEDAPAAGEAGCETRGWARQPQSYKTETRRSPFRGCSCQPFVRLFIHSFIR